MPDVNFTDLFNLPPEKAIAYFKSKGYAFSWDWQDIWQEAHAKAFTVAKAMRMDVLQTIRDEVQQALATGMTLRDFQKDLTPKLQSLGWWGRQTVGDETGGTEVQLGSPWRLSTIYRTNMQTAYMAGRYADFMDNVDDRPYWQYVAVMDSKTRPAHRALNGLVFRYDDPFWDTHYPPNDWNCRCRVRALSQGNVDDRGLRVSTGEGNLSNEPVLVSRKTGELAEVTVYTDPRTHAKMAPGAGWNYNPGKAAWHPDLDRYDYDVAKNYLLGGLSGPSFTRFYEGKIGGNYPVAVLDDEYKTLINANSQTVLLSDESFIKNKSAHPELGIEDYQKLPLIISEAQVVVQDGTNTVVFIKRDGKIYHAVVKSTVRGDALYLTSFRFTSKDDMARVINRGRVLKNEM